MPYFATQQAYEAMGLQRQLADVEQLRAGTEDEQFGGFAQSGAFVGLGPYPPLRGGGLFARPGDVWGRLQPGTTGSGAGIGPHRQE